MSSNGYERVLDVYLPTSCYKENEMGCAFRRFSEFNIPCLHHIYTLSTSSGSLGGRSAGTGRGDGISVCNVVRRSPYFVWGKCFPFPARVRPSRILNKVRCNYLQYISPSNAAVQGTATHSVTHQPARHARSCLSPTLKFKDGRWSCREYAVV